MKELEKILKQLRLYKPRPDERDLLRENIMQQIRRKDSGINYFFGWTEIIWLRRSMSVAAVLIIGLFIIQQAFVVGRIDELEKRMVNINTENILDYQRENVMLNSILLEEEVEGVYDDSLKVASDDLLDLVRSYRDLQKKYEEMLGEIKKNRSESLNQKL